MSTVLKLVRAVMMFDKRGKDDSKSTQSPGTAVMSNMRFTLLFNIFFKLCKHLISTQGHVNVLIVFTCEDISCIITLPSHKRNPQKEM